MDFWIKCVEDGMRKKEMLVKINELLLKKGAHVISFKYYKKVFGNMVLVIDFQNKEHVFVVDRREIYYNGKFLFDFHQEGNDYYRITKEFPNLNFLLKAIEEKLT